MNAERVNDSPETLDEEGRGFEAELIRDVEGLLDTDEGEIMEAGDILRRSERRPFVAPLNLRRRLEPANRKAGDLSGRPPPRRRIN